jgi:glycine dehydrogenase subunit 2
VVDKLAEFLPVPVIVEKDGYYHLDYDRPKSIGRVRDFLGNLPVVLRSYAWSLAMGAQGLRRSAEISMLNNQYLMKKLEKIRGVTMPYGGMRLDQVRWSLQKLKDETGVGVNDVSNRVVDYGVQSYFKSHHPWIVPEPFTPEPCETYSKADIDYWAAVLQKVCEEAYEDPELVKSAPHRSSNHKENPGVFNNPEKWAMSWRAYKRKRGLE